MKIKGMNKKINQSNNTKDALSQDVCVKPTNQSMKLTKFRQISRKNEFKQDLKLANMRQSIKAFPINIPQIITRSNNNSRSTHKRQFQKHTS